MAIGSGFAEISEDKVSVLTDMALGEDEIDEATAEEAVKAAEESIKNADQAQDPEEYAHLQNMLRSNLAKLNYKRRRKH